MSENVEKKSENSDNSTDTDCPFCDTACPNPECVYKERKEIINLERWCNKDGCKIVEPSEKSDLYLEYRDDTYWISGIDRLWLLNNGYKLKALKEKK